MAGPILYVGPSSPPTFRPDSNVMPVCSPGQTTISGSGHNVVMADDEIERLLREIDAANASATGKPTGKPTGEVAKVSKDVETTKGGGGRLAFSVVAAVGLGAATWFVGLILPFTSAVSAGIGGAIAAFITAMIAGPPRWFSR